MVNLHNLHKIKIPTIQVRLLAVMLIGVLFTSVAFAGGVRDYGQDPNRQCRVPSWGSASTPDTTDWSNPPSGFGPASTLDSDDTIPNCKRMERISYTSDPTGSGVQVSGGGWRYSCAECNSGYHTYSLSMPSTMVVDCVVTWEECIKDTPCDGLVCEGMSSWGSYSGTSSTHNQTRCNSSTNKCEYRCLNGYYDKGGAIVVGGAKRCAVCPSNATCSNVATPDISCHAGYYLVSEGNSINGYTKTCPACPTLGLNNVKGRSTYGSTSITRCYIPPNTNIKDTTGEYQFTSNCYYTTGASVAN